MKHYIKAKINRSTKKGIKALILIAVVVSASSIAFAYPGAGKSRMCGGPNVERMAKKLNIEEGQMAEFQSVMNAQKQKRLAFREEIKQKKEQLRADTVNRLSGLLNEKQKQKMNAMMEKKQKRMKEKMAKCEL